jgi:D-sedoheptulose 7-phosphate isomerase
MTALAGVVQRHVDAVEQGLGPLRSSAPQLERWAGEIVRRIEAGGRVLIAGNGGSAAQAEHFAAELVGRYRDDRKPLPGISLSADAAVLTALGNDYGGERLFARQVEALARAGDVLMLLSTSGRSANLLAAARSAEEGGVLSIAFSGPTPNPLAAACDEAFCAWAPTTAAVQELHLVALHALCECIDQLLTVAA